MDSGRSTNGYLYSSNDFPQISSNTYSCNICKEEFTSDSSYNTHLGSVQHLASYIKRKLREHMKEYLSDKKGMSVTSERECVPSLQLISEPNQTLTVEFSVKNDKGTKPIKFYLCCLLHKMPVFQLSDDYNVCKDENSVRIRPGQEYKITVTAKAEFVGAYKVPLIFTFVEDNTEDIKKPFFIIRILELLCGNQTVQSLEPVENFDPSSKRRPKPQATQIIRVESRRKIDDKYPVPPLMIILHMHDYKPWKGMSSEERDFLNYVLSSISGGLSEDRYTSFFRVLLYMEEVQLMFDIEKYSLENVLLMPLRHNNAAFLSLEVPGLAEKRPSVLKGDMLYVRFRHGEELEDTEYEGEVEYIWDTKVILRFSEAFNKVFIKGMPVDVRFTFNRRAQDVMHEALCILHSCSPLPKIIFPQTNTAATGTPCFSISAPLRFFDSHIENNKEQKMAVMHILAASSRPSPYLVFGPPGTGKTVTLVEAIKQIYTNIPSAHILVATQSNSAADVITKRLLNHIPPRHLIRQYAMSYDPSKIVNEIKKCCNLNALGNGFNFPSTYRDLISYRIIICSLVTSVRLKHLGFPKNYFTHIFVDEAGQAVEPEVLIPISGILKEWTSKSSQPGGLLVLAGDPEQLGPVIHSNLVRKKGLDKSFLERLMKECEVYKRGPTGSFNPKVLTKLVQNYRSHPSILKIPNELFYDGELLACAHKLERESLCQWEGLPRKGFPLIFHGILGRDMREGNSPSYYNPEEVSVVMQYVDDLIAKKNRGIVIKSTDIGIISPYRKQVIKIQNALKKKNLNISVGSVEEFQGQERRIIIISTVRSNPDLTSFDYEFKLGFLRNPKRFNVSITRAKALLIVIGNPYILCRDKHWNELLVYCKEQGGYKGIHFEHQNDINESLMDATVKSEFFKEIPEFSQRMNQEEPQWRAEE